MSGRKMKKIPLLVWPGKLKTWWSFLLILLILGANKATLSEWSYLWGHPGGRLRCLTSSGIPTTTTKLRASQKSDLFNFWGAPVPHMSLGEKNQVQEKCGNNRAFWEIVEASGKETRGNAVLCLNTVL